MVTVVVLEFIIRVVVAMKVVVVEGGDGCVVNEEGCGL